MERFVQTQLQAYRNIAKNMSMRITFPKFFKIVYKIRAIIVFYVFTRLIVEHLLLDLTWGHFCLL